MWVYWDSEWSDCFAHVDTGSLQVEALERVKKLKEEGAEGDEKDLIQEELSKIVLNPNVFTDFKVAGSPEVGANLNSKFFLFFFHVNYF